MWLASRLPPFEVSVFETACQSKMDKRTSGYNQISGLIKLSIVTGESSNVVLKT